ncbi:2357_t:CDS:2, partial [Gigaspora margarita]
KAGYIIQKFSGLSQHENGKYNNYNIPPIQSYILPESAINEWKEMLVHAIYKQHPLAFENWQTKEPIGVFFSGFDAYQTISSLLDDYCWGVDIISAT